MEEIKDLVYRQDAIDALDKEYRCTDQSDDWDGLKTAMLIIENLPSAQPELIEKEAYIRGFEQGRTQGMIDSQGGKK